MAILPPNITIHVKLDAGQPGSAAVLGDLLRRVHDLQAEMEMAETGATPEPPAEPFPEDIEVEAALDQLAMSYGPGVSAFSNTAELARALTATIRQRREAEPRG